MYLLAQRRATSAGEDPVAISLFRAVAHQFRDLRRINNLKTMNVVSHLIEEQVLLHGLPITFYAGFQRLSNVAAQRRRYERLASVCQRVYLFGANDAPPPPIAGVEYVALAPDDPLAREWFLVVDTPGFWTALLTEELSEAGVAGERRYDGIWSYDQRVTERARLLLSQHLGGFFEPTRERDHERQSGHVSEISRRLLGHLEGADALGQRRWLQLYTLQKFAEALAANQRILGLAETLARLMHTVFGADDAALAIRVSGTRAVVASAHGGPADERDLPLNDGPSGEAFRRGELVVLPNARRSRKLDPLLPSAQSLIAAPVVGRRRTYGVLTVATSQDGGWGAEDGPAVLALAGLLAGALDQRADSLHEVALRIEQSRAVEQSVDRLRQFTAQLSELQRELRLLGGAGLTPTQRMALERAEALADELARDIAPPDEPPPARLPSRRGQPTE
jgi:DICT domain-containing protein